MLIFLLVHQQLVKKNADVHWQKVPRQTFHTPVERMFMCADTAMILWSEISTTIFLQSNIKLQETHIQDIKKNMKVFLLKTPTTKGICSN